MPPRNHACPLATMHTPHNHAHPPTTMHAPCNHACSLTTMHAPPATTHAPWQPRMPPSTHTLHPTLPQFSFAVGKNVLNSIQFYCGQVFDFNFKIPKVKIFKTSPLSLHEWAFYDAQTKGTQRQLMLEPELKAERCTSWLIHSMASIQCAQRDIFEICVKGVLVPKGGGRGVWPYPLPLSLAGRN